MMAFTHIAFGAASALLAAEWLNVPAPQTVLMLAGGVLGSMLPDIDHPSSAFGRRVLPISMMLSAVFGHRGITHSLLAVVGMSVLAWYSLRHLNWHPGYSVPFVVGITAGYLSHLAGDWMTNSGVPLLWPSKRRFVAPLRIVTGDFRERLLAFAVYGWVIVHGLRTLER
ncbi:metal-dependent hydrolase [Burkholderia multivorans]|uniref:metal-dependent hydrolase n=1 Tax=Burkholderia multivorans TaxID=87883 RepID=UPI0028580D33|nr:metal-dependent hydrolase [Burkholderia multivorans]MDR9065313.1 Inner membrane protein YdjM [Burkholderia multivorans]MDR9091821.1 Inner membrane protein YdjM [Burkholderia multivorans]MDR9119906.1 Inner membrane protein YdjM [Burkholderia multivorans]MDR9157286.1 Inner membrane protein YdjM [Burkholderia multivorans]MDR9166727.1 Inner membrane protein YdjM [Burkholderia multivorans]